MLKNVTLSAEERLIEQARLLAQQEKKTLNTLFREWLARYTAKQAAAVRYRELMRGLKRVTPGRKFSRDESNAR